jgi:hypothetical protein
MGGKIGIHSLISMAKATWTITPYYQMNDFLMLECPYSQFIAYMVFLILVQKRIVKPIYFTSKLVVGPQDHMMLSK